MMDDDELLNWLDELLIALHTTYDQTQVDSRKLITLIYELGSFRDEFHQRANAQDGVAWTTKPGR